MLKKISILVLVGAAAACGGPAADEFARSAPSFDSVSMDMNDSDSVATSERAPVLVSTEENLDSDPCHPHLFSRTREIVRATNGGLFKLLGRVDELVRIGPHKRERGTHEWIKVKDGFTWKYEMIKTADHAFTATLQVKKEADPDTAYVTVYSAESTRTPAEHDGSGSATLDMTALHSVVTSEPVSGKLAMSFTLSAAAKTVIFTMTGYQNGAADVRNGKYVFLREHGKGGSLKFTENLPLSCTGPGGSATGTTPIDLVSRWIETSAGVHYRADALATGGQVAAGSKWEGVTCAEGARHEEGHEGYWQMKLEDAGGATVSGSSHQNTAATAAACDPAFGPVPKVDGSASDYDFAAIDFTSDAAVAFPGR